MKVNDSNLQSLGSVSGSAAATGATKSQETERLGQSARSNNASGTNAVSQDDVHLSELVRSLRSLAADSPERQARLEQMARSYASGTYQVDTGGTASKIIDDAFKR
jgi:flagellar biosynthesis anti-sigma factor FlgM